METLLIFLLIAGIQMVAAYLKQKKAAKKAAERKNVPIPSAEHQEASPVPDPFKEIREAMGLPPAEEYAPEPEAEPELEQTLEPEPKPEPMWIIEPERLEGLRPRVLAETQQPVAEDSECKKNKIKIDISKLSQGILWTAILQEPRYKKKWKHA